MSQQPLMNHEVVLPVVVDGYHWECNSDRMWNLNELHKELGLPDEKKPYRWDNQVRTVLDQARNFVVLVGRNGGTLATEAGAIAYAMWVSPEFYLKVINAFIALRNDKVTEAKALAQDSKELKGLKPVATHWLEKLDNPAQGQTMSECLKVLGFKNRKGGVLPASTMNKVLKSGRIHNPFYRKTNGINLSTGLPEMAFNKIGMDNAYYRLQDSLYNQQAGLKVLTKGFEWLKANKSELLAMASQVVKA